MAVDPVSMVVGGALAEFGKKILGRLADDVYEKWKARRGENVDAVLQESCEMVTASGKEAHEVPPRLLVPILNGAALEDDAELRRRWAALLANAATTEQPEDLPPYYATILSQLTPFAARVLRDLPDGNNFRDAIRAIARGQYPVPGAELSHIAQHLGVEANERLKATLDLLAANGLLNRAIDMPDESNPLAMRLGPAERFSLTTLGQRFLAACEPPTIRES